MRDPAKPRAGNGYIDLDESGWMHRWMRTVGESGRNANKYQTASRQERLEVSPFGEIIGLENCRLYENYEKKM